MQKYRVLVVDDEYAARETLRRLVNWEHFGFEPPTIASDARTALQLWQENRFELILADIEMPGMNGIELIEAIRAQCPSQRIVIISCHEKFDYARRALQLGVEDYFVKDLLTEKELSAFLSAFVVQSKAQNPPPSPQEEALFETLRLAAAGQPIPDAVQPAVMPCVAVLAVIADDYDAQCALVGEEEMLERFSACIASMESPAHYYPGGDTAYLLFEVEPNASMLYYYSAVTGIASRVSFIAKKKELASISIGISNLCKNISELPKACRDAAEAVQMRIIVGPGRVTLADTILLKKSALDFRRTDYLLKCIEDFSHHANTACLPLIDKLYQVELPSSFADIHYFRYVNARLWALMLAVSRIQGREYSTVLESLGTSVEDVNRMESSREMSTFFKNFLLNLFAEDDKPENDHLLNRALRLIEREYTQDISLRYVAEKLHTNKSYLSRLFKEQTGDSVMNYIMKKKMARAKHLLLRTQMKLYEISDSLGIASPQYFSTVFKRYTGLSPNEFKKSLPELENLR